VNQLPNIDVLEPEEFWSQRAIDTPEAVLEELSQLREKKPVSDVNQSLTATGLSKLVE
jgi:hypothetical protein